MARGDKNQRTQHAGVGRTPEARGLKVIGVARAPRTARLERNNGRAVASQMAARVVAEPFASLAKKGDYSGYVKTPFGQVHVNILQGRDPARREPLVLLGGITYSTLRIGEWADMLKKMGGPTVIFIELPGQSRTLRRSIEDGRDQSKEKRTPSDQAAAVVAVLDALRLKHKVNIGGVSYGAANAMTAMAEYPDRFSKLLVMEPYVSAEHRDLDSKWKTFKAMTIDNPFNPFGEAQYRGQTKLKFKQVYTYKQPTYLEGYYEQYIDSLANMALGADDFRIKETLQRIPEDRLKDVNFLLQEGSVAHAVSMKALVDAELKIGTFLAIKTAEHDLVHCDPFQSSQWTAIALGGKKAIPRVNKFVKSYLKELKRQLKLAEKAKAKEEAEKAKAAGAAAAPAIAEEARPAAGSAEPAGEEGEHSKGAKPSASMFV
jgi:pimeloyl-ACP methyl ester carboxylesterase